MFFFKWLLLLWLLSLFRTSFTIGGVISLTGESYRSGVSGNKGRVTINCFYLCCFSSREDVFFLRRVLRLLIQLISLTLSLCLVLVLSKAPLLSKEKASEAGLGAMRRCRAYSSQISDSNTDRAVMIHFKKRNNRWNWNENVDGVNLLKVMRGNSGEVEAECAIDEELKRNLEEREGPPKRHDVWDEKERTVDICELFQIRIVKMEYFLKWENLRKETLARERESSQKQKLHNTWNNIQLKN